MVERFDDFMLHSRSVEHKTTANSITLGSGYNLSVRSDSPEMKRWKLTFYGYKWYLNQDGSIDYETNKSKNNFGRLIDFAQRHDVVEPFIYSDPVYGDTLVRFENKIDEPVVIRNSGGVVENFSVNLVEVSE